jgi:hypothetical protein
MEHLIEPSPIGFSFGAPGWYVLGVLFLMVVASVVTVAVIRYRRNKYRRMALRQMSAWAPEYMRKGNYAEWVYRTNNLVKRVAMQVYSREEVASCRASEWIGFLNDTCRRAGFSEEDVQLLSQFLFQPPHMITAEKASTFSGKASYWIKKHKHTYHAH